MVAQLREGSQDHALDLAVDRPLADSMVAHLREGSQDHTRDLAVGAPLADSILAHLREGLQDHSLEQAAGAPLAESILAHLQEGPQDHSPEQLRHRAKLVCVPARPAVLTIEAPPRRTPSVDGRDSTEDSMVAGDQGRSPFPKDPTSYAHGGNTHSECE